jgi:hypothetical protein
VRVTRGLIWSVGLCVFYRLKSRRLRLRALEFWVIHDMPCSMCTNDNIHCSKRTRHRIHKRLTHELSLSMNLHITKMKYQQIQDKSSSGLYLSYSVVRPLVGICPRLEQHLHHRRMTRLARSLQGGPTTLHARVRGQHPLSSQMRPLV